VLTLVQSYTASLSSLLTAKRLQPSVTDPSQLLRNGDYVRYQNGSFVLAKLKHLKFDERKIKVFSTPEEYAKALRAGSNNGGVSAIFDELPLYKYFPRAVWIRVPNSWSHRQCCRIWFCKLLAPILLLTIRSPGHAHVTVYIMCYMSAGFP
jgi:hypothetical protein